MNDDFEDEALHRARHIADAVGDGMVVSRLLHNAQISVLRRIVSRTLPGGEDEFWRLVCEEIPDSDYYDNYLSHQEIR